MDPLERTFLRPRQVRYQAALRPDSNCFLILNHFHERYHGKLLICPLVVQRTEVLF